jgi:hypothetical protein
VCLAHADLRDRMERLVSAARSDPQANGQGTGGEPWDTEWAAERAAEALRYLGRNFPECLGALQALEQHEHAAHEAAMRADREGYLEALRAYMRAGRSEALRIRRGV